MSHLRKIGDLISSFLSKESRKRKRDKDENVTESQAKKSKITNSLDKEAFMTRVGTYSWPGWGGRKVGPLMLARYGWEALQDQQLMVRCTFCQVRLPLWEGKKINSNMAGTAMAITSGGLMKTDCTVFSMKLVLLLLLLVFDLLSVLVLNS